MPLIVIEITELYDIEGRSEMEIFLVEITVDN